MAAVADLLEDKIYIADTGNNRVLLVKLPLDTPDAVWNAMVQQLTAPSPSIEGAVSYFSQLTANDYRQAFLCIGTAKISSDMNSIGTLSPVFIENDTAEYYFEQTIEGNLLLFPVEFVNENGAWKVLEF